MLITLTNLRLQGKVNTRLGEHTALQFCSKICSLRAFYEWKIACNEFLWQTQVACFFCCIIDGEVKSEAQNDFTILGNLGNLCIWLRYKCLKGQVFLSHLAECHMVREGRTRSVSHVRLSHDTWVMAQVMWLKQTGICLLEWCISLLEKEAGGKK